MSNNYEDILDTGDIILFSGNYIVSKAIELVTDCVYSHVAVIIKNPKFIDKELEDGLYIIESGAESINDPENNRKKFGVQLTKLDYIMKNYDGKIYYRKLDCIRDKKFYDDIYNIHSDVHNLPYDDNIIDLIKADLNLNIGNTQKKNTFWCSALVAFIYVKLNFLDSETPWTIIKPCDFSDKSKNLLFKNCTVEKEILIKN